LEVSVSYELEDALAIVSKYPGQFRSGFAVWLEGNWDLYAAFEKEALRVAAVRAHYSAARIIEWLRHDTAMREEGERDGFKLNQAWTSSIARLFANRYPDHSKLFEYRVREDAVVGPLPFKEVGFAC
jgi:hypothetical protein